MNGTPLTIFKELSSSVKNTKSAMSLRLAGSLLRNNMNIRYVIMFFCVSLIILGVKVDLSVLKLFMLFNHHLLKEYFK